MKSGGYIRLAACVFAAGLLAGGCASTHTSSKDGPGKLEKQLGLDIIVQKVANGIVCSAVIPGGADVRQGDVHLELFDQNGKPITLTPLEAPDRLVPVAGSTAHALYRLNLKPGQHPTSGVVRWAGHRQRVQPLGWLDHGKVISGEPAAGGKAE